MSNIQEQLQSGEGPTGDTFTLKLTLAPVSQQANSQAKRQFQEQIRRELAKVNFFFSGDVQLEVEWLTNEQERYETDRSPDVDNILKPLIDAISGPSGIIFDDNQVQSICCSWVDWNGDESIEVRIRFFSDEWLPGREFIFVQFAKSLCYPLPTRLGKELQAQFVGAFKRSLEARAELEGMGVGYGWAKTIMPALRVFHRTRIWAFPVVSVEEFEQDR